MVRALDRLLAEVVACRTCREAPRFGAPLPHEPRPVLRISASARILIAGQAPGTRVHASGKPYTDPSGDRLRRWLGVSAEEFYDVSRVAIVPMGLCFPGLDGAGADLPPRRECVLLWHDRVMVHLKKVELVLAIGRYAQLYHFNRLGLASWLKPSLAQTMESWREIFVARQAPAVLPLPHPSWRNSAWLKRNPWFERDVVPVIQMEVRRLLSETSGKSDNAGEAA